jgi:hypothetical protein
VKRILLVIALVATSASLNGLAQTRTAGQQGRNTATWTMPRTPDGHPDLHGLWTTQTFTPLERPQRYAGQEFLTEQEAEELTKLLTQAGVDPLAAGIFGASDEERRKRAFQNNDGIHYNNADWLTTSQRKALSSRRTSLIYDPPDGKLPPLTPEARERAAARRAKVGLDSYENRTLQEQCVIWSHEGPPMMPPPYNDALQLIQTPGYLVVHRELATSPRIIPLDGRPHSTAMVRPWNGDTRGHWEGDTLVVDTVHFNDKTATLGSSDALHVVERFTRVSADRILYQFTVDDPTTWTRPWSAEIPMVQTEDPVIEFACHEGNYGLVNILQGARYRERQAAEKAKGTSAR